MIKKAIHIFHTEVKIKAAHRSSGLAKFQREDMNKKERAESQRIPGGQPARRDNVAKFLKLLLFPITSSEASVIRIHIF